MTTVIAVSKRKVDAFIVAKVHRTANQRADSFFIIADRVTHILNLSAVAELPEASLQILLLNRSDFLCHMAVEAVAHIRSVGDTFYQSVHLAELLYLKTTQTLCRCSINRIQISVFFLIIVYLLVDIF